MNIPVSCNKDCGAGCPLTAVVEDGKITAIRDSDRKGEWMSGCARGYGAHRVLNAPGRLLTPMLRETRSGGHRPADWDEALDFAARKLEAVRDKYGPEAVIRLGGSGACRGALHNTSRLAQRFLNCFGGYTETTGSYSSAAVSFVTPFVFGTSDAAVDAGSLSSSRFILLQGANIADLRFGSELMNRLKALRADGVGITVVDPRRTRTVTELDAEWIRINPATDAAFIAGIIHDLIENGGLDYSFIDKYCHGFGDYRSWLVGSPARTPEWAAEICGCSAADIRGVAESYRRFSPAALIPGLSIQRNLGGEDAARSAMVLQAVTGNIGIRGGSSGANIWGPSENPRCKKISALPPRAPGEPPPRMHYVPVYTWPDVVLNDDGAQYPPVKAVCNCGGNYLVQGADTNKSRRAFDALEFSMTADLFMTPTASASDVVFPAADFLERSDIVFPEGNFLLYSARAVSPPAGVKTDYEIFSLLAGRLGFEQRFTEGRDENAWLEHFLESSDVDDTGEFRRSGIFFGGRSDRFAFEQFRADPSTSPLNTPSGRIEISSEKYAELGASPFPVYSPQSGHQRARPALRLITPHRRERINSQALGRKVESVAKIEISRTDAGVLGIEQGMRVRVFNEFGETRAIAAVTDGIIEGTACLDCSRSNMLTSTEPTRPSGGARTHTTFVDIEPASHQNRFHEAED